MIEIMRQNISKALYSIAHPVIWQLVVVGNLLDCAPQLTNEGEMVVAPDIHERVDAADEQYFRSMAESVAKKKLEDLRAGRDEALQRLGRALDPMQTLLKRQAYVCGELPAYGDYILFSIFQWARVMSPREVLAPEDPVCAWRERMLDLFDGFARNVPAA